MLLPFCQTGNGIINSENKLIRSLALVLLKEKKNVRFLELSNKLFTVTTRDRVFFVD